MKIFTYIKNKSYRIDSKNFIPICGRPLWTILTEELSQISDFYIDTDSPKVIDHCLQNYSNVHTYTREQHFIDMENDITNKQSPALLMTKNFLNRYVKSDEEIIVLTHITSPFLKKETVLEASKLIEKDEYEFVHSVTSRKDFAWLSSVDNPINFDPKIVQRTQDLDEIIFSNGAFFIFKKKNFMKYNNRLGKNNFLFKLDRIQGIEIDYPEDLELAKIIARRRNENY
jgi:CMP-N-acetylneuraminic acid synthetase